MKPKTIITPIHIMFLLEENDLTRDPHKKRRPAN